MEEEADSVGTVLVRQEVTAHQASIHVFSEARDC